MGDDVEEVENELIGKIIDGAQAFAAVAFGIGSIGFVAWLWWSYAPC